jgi:hypothetical protein
VLELTAEAGSGGAEPVIRELSITENGTYTAPDGVDGYSPVVVNVPTGGGGGDTSVEDGLVARTLTSYTNDRVTSIGADFFYSNTTIQTVSFPKVTSVGAEAFRACSNLVSVNFPNAVTIGQHAFRNSVKLTEVVFPKVTSIGGYAFRENTGLVKADFSKAASITTYSFYGCTALTALILRNSTVTSLGSTNALTNTPIASGTGYVYVPAALVNTYKGATNWSGLAAQFRAIEDYPAITGG